MGPGSAREGGQSELGGFHVTQPRLQLELPPSAPLDSVPSCSVEVCIYKCKYLE